MWPKKTPQSFEPDGLEVVIHGNEVDGYSADLWDAGNIYRKIETFGQLGRRNKFPLAQARKLASQALYDERLRRLTYYSETVRA